MKIWRDWAGMARSPVAPLLFGQLVMFTGIAAIFPVAPLYVRAHGGSAVDAAVFVASALVANTVVQVPAGKLCDRIGRRPVLLGSRLAGAAVCFALFADVGPLWVLIALRTLEGACAGAFVPALRAALSDLTPPGRRAQRFAQLQACEMLGLVIGPLLGGLAALWRPASIFGIAGAALLIGVTAMTRVPETTEPVSPAAPSSSIKAARWWRNRGVLVPSLCLVAVGLVFSMYDVVWPQYLVARGYNTLVVGVSISLYALPIIVLAQRAGKLADRSESRKLVAVSMGVTAACVATYPGLRSLTPILLLGLVEALATMAVEPSLFAVIGNNSAAAVRGQMMGIGGLFQGGGSALGAAGLGVLYGLDERWAFYGGAAALLLGAILAFMALPKGAARNNVDIPPPILETGIT